MSSSFLEARGGWSAFKENAILEKRTAPIDL